MTNTKNLNMSKDLKRCRYCGVEKEMYEGVTMCRECYKNSLLKRDLMDLKILVKDRGRKWILKNI